MSTDSSALLNMQRDVHGRISRSVDNLKKLGAANITLSAVETRIRLLDQLWEKFESQHDLIIASYKEKYTESEYVKSNFFDTAEITYVQQRSALEEHAIRIRAASGKPSPSQDSACESSSKALLPRIKLPIFSGVYEEWPAFRDLFLSVVGENSAISKVERLHYLRSCLKGPPEKLIQSLTITSENYDRAWAALTHHFENKRELIRSNFAAFTAASKMKADTAEELDRVYLAVTTAVNAQESIGRPIESHGTDLFNFLVVELFDPRTRLEWESSISDSREPPKLETVLDFIAKRTLALKASKPKSCAKSFSDTSRTAKAHFAGRGTDNSLCVLCKAKHHVMTCSQFKAKSAGERKTLAEEHKLCFNCLGNHQMARCQSTKTCLTCKARHHTLLHDAYSHGKSTEASSLTAVRQTEDRKATLLATARVDVTDRHGEPHPVRALIDQGSEVSIISESLVQRLHLKRAHSSVAIYGIGGARSGSTNGKVSMNVSSRVTGAELHVVAFVLPRLSAYTGSRTGGCPRWPHLKGLPLADPHYGDSDPVELLLGAEVCSAIIEADLRRGGPYAPVAQKTRLGWILFGGHGRAVDLQPRTSLQCSADHELSELVHRFWAQEKEPDASQSLAPEDQRCEDFFRRTHTRKESGRYMVRLPFSTAPPDLSETRIPAERLLAAMERKGNQDPRFGSLYESFMQEYEDLGHMEPVSYAEGPLSKCYLPHHGVLRDSGTATKMRVVFNGSQRTRKGESINSYLLVGENLLPSLPSVLMRWRCLRYALITDVEKMYRQILVHPDDREYQRVLWKDSTSAAIREFRLCTVTYGLACAPFLAIRTLRQLADDEGGRFPQGAIALRNDSYVDDVITGANTLADAITVRTELHELCTAGGFPLRKWAASDDRVLAGVPQDHRLETPHQWSGQGHCTLGLRWDPHSDTFAFAIHPRTQSTLTKRRVLAETARLFDPMGWLAPVIVRAKIMLQSAWLRRLEWDSPLPESDTLDWEHFLAELPRLRRLKVNRWLNTGTADSRIQLHGFADASERAYAAAVYLRVSTGDETVVRLLTAKSKVAPVKPVTLPRLELCAAALLTSLVRNTRVILNLPTDPVFMWSDSRVALHWIQGHASRWKTYVANRVSRIQEELPAARWRHVAGRDNPADCASRGIAPGQLEDHPLWWTGPAWLRSSQDSWPNSESDPPPSDVPDRRVTTQTATLGGDEEPEVLRQFSSLTRLLRTTAWCLRWRNIMRHRAKPEVGTSLSLDPQEVEDALFTWIRRAQQTHYREEMTALSKSRRIPAKSTLLKLSPFIDDDGVLRVGGRLKHSPLSYDERHPVIIPPTSWLTRLIVDAYHRRTLHGGVQLTLGMLRRRYWLPRGRAVTKQRLHDCTTCTRWRAVSPHPQMANLPRARVTPARPFHSTGVDYAGPIMLRTSKGRGHRSHKAFIAVFVCLSTRAVHIEVVSDYSTEAFLAAFRRFTARRGLCRDIYSDCGTNFVGADRALREMFRASSADGRRMAHAVAEQTRWHFNPPAAPHFGGLWEAAVKSVKHHLRRVIGQSTLTYEEISTLLAQVEACLNSRPLHALSDDPADLSALTPGHFLIGAPLLAVPEPSTAGATSTLTRWRLVQQMRNHFWDRWSHEYIHGLATRPKWHRIERAPEVGALCLIRSETAPPNQWPMARITELHPGSDGVIRVVTVRTASSQLVRPLVKIVLLPSASEAEQSA